MAGIVDGGEDRPTLTVRYETGTPIDAVSLGTLVIELGRGFDRFARSRRLRGVRLALVAAGLGSHWIEMAVVGATTAGATAIRFRKDIYEFADFLGKLVAVAKGGGKEAAKAADKKLVDAIAAPVSRNGATGVTINVFGGQPVIRIDRQAAGELWPADRDPDPDPDDQRSSAATSIASSRKVRAAPPARLHRHFGTILDVKGEWYVRLEGHEGVLNPATPGTGVSVVDGQAYELDGFWNGRRYVIRAAAPTGPV